MNKIRVDTRKESKDGQVEKLKNRVRRLKKDKDQMATTIKQLRRQINEQQEYINKHVSKKTINEVLDENKIKEPEIDNKVRCVSCDSTNVTYMELSFGKMVKCKTCDSVTIVKN